MTPISVAAEVIHCWERII